MKKLCILYFFFAFCVGQVFCQSTTKRKSVASKLLMELAIEEDANCVNCGTQEEIEEHVEHYKTRLNLTEEQVHRIKQLYRDNRTSFKHIVHNKSLSSSEKVRLVGEIRDYKRKRLSEILNYKQMKEFTQIRRELKDENLKNTKFFNVKKQVEEGEMKK